jgi:trehalose synthase
VNGMGAKLDDYRVVAPRGSVDFMLRIADRLRGRRIVQVSVSRYGAAAEILKRIVPILNDLGIETGWEVVIGSADFDAIVTTVSKGLAGVEQVVTEAMLARLHATCASNARRLPLDADLVIVHDAAALLLVEGRPPGGRWLWRYHGDLSSPQPQLWNALRPFVDKYDAAVFSTPRFAAPLSTRRFLIAPSIDPLSERNREMPRVEQSRHLERLGVRSDKPVLLQVGPFERLQDPLGVINAYRLVKLHHDVRLVLAGPPPRAGGVLTETQEAASQDPDITVVVLPPDPETELNALERAATIVLQKPLSTDFGIDVAAAMWKGKPVVGSLAGGIPSQIVSKVTGYTVETVEGAAFRIRHLLSNPEMIGRMGAAGREHVRRNFLITRHLGDYLALLAHLSGQTSAQASAPTSAQTSAPTSG